MQSHKALKFLVLILVLSITAFIPAPAPAETVNLRLAHSEPTTNPRHDASLFFAKRVAELTNGEVKIEVFPAGTLGTHQSCQQQVSMGVLDFYITTAGLVSTYDDKRVQELVELPYLFDTYSQAYAFMDTPYVTKLYEPLK